MQNHTMLGSRISTLFQFLHQRDLRVALRRWNQVTLQDKLDRTSRYQHLIAKFHQSPAQGPDEKRTEREYELSASHGVQGSNEPLRIPARTLTLSCKFLVRVVDQILQKRHQWAWSRLLRLLEAENLKPIQNEGAADYNVGEYVMRGIRRKEGKGVNNVTEEDGRRGSGFGSSSVSQKRFTLVDSSQSLAVDGEVVDASVSFTSNGFEKDTRLAVLRFKGSVVTGQARRNVLSSGVT
eukprot:Protomagalhaensia_sp_Gyna_25__5124@NODE_595_length_3046_cov_7_183904_g461_i0_p2_GENE_NODE_595_length_3046_cov_7_183904_g461_i0NODE_595_length_3046_cov_7_183904_g461_i0_p2_ORF_typecomplete_len237_score23_37_NODE_595_length_3046_cov_7_183904_g461_i022342944